MVWDLLIALAVTTCGWATAYMGLQLTLHPPKTARSTTTYKAGFVGLAVISTGLILGQVYRNAEASRRAEAAQLNIASEPHTA